MNYKINFKLLALCCAVTFTLSGCKKASKSGDPIDPAGDYQRINITMPLEDRGVITRAGDAAAEVAIKSAYIIIYANKVADSALPKFTATIDVERITTDATNINHKVITFPKDDGIVAGDDVRVVFNHSLASLNIPKGSLKEVLKITTATSVTSAGLVDITKGLPMYGAGLWGANSKGGTTISVRRGVAKVQLKLDYRGQNHVEGVMGASYTTANTTFKLYQLSNVGYADGSVTTSTGSVAITEITNVSEINQPSVSTAAVDNFTGASYIFAYPYSTQSIGTSPTIFTDKKPKTERIAMIMKNKTDNGDVYHRLDIYDATTKEYLDIKNNYHYIIKLREVNVGGYKSASEALTGPPSNIQYDIIVEEEGDVVVSNGQYVLNVDTKGSDFAVTPNAGKEVAVEVAVVNLIDSKDAPLTHEPSFNVSLEEYFRVSLATDDIVLTPKFPATLGKSTKSINVNAKGTGAVIFRYNASLGNIVYKSNLIAIGSNIGAVPAEVLGETFIFNVNSLSIGGVWSVVSDSPTWAPATINGDRFKVVISANDFAGARKRIATITVSNDDDVTIVITITQRSFPYFADRNIGTSWDLTTQAELCLPANSKPTNPYYWATAEPRRWFTWKESLTQCDNWNFKGKKWRLPDKYDCDLVVASGRMQFGNALDKAGKLQQSDGSVVYFPMVGYSDSHYRVYAPYWTSSPDGDANAYYYFVLPPARTEVLGGYWQTGGLSVRCIEA